MAALQRAKGAIDIPAAEHIEPDSHVAVGREAAVVVVATECRRSAASGLC
jgi:hypothetical protein